MADNEVTVRIVTEADTSQVDDLKSAMENVQAEANSAGDSLQEAFQQATAEVERLQEALDEAHLNGDDIEADIIADELAEAESEAESLAEAIASIDSSNAANAASDFDEIGNSADQADTEVQELQDSLGMIEASAMLAVADQIGSLGSSAEGMAQDMNTAAISVGQLSTNVGMAEPQMVSLINNISNATFPQNEAMAYVNALNQMGVSANNLGGAATNMDRINDATGIGYSKVMQLTQGLQAVGVSADNLPSAFNAIAFAQANVNGGADTLTTVLKRQAATINEYGLNTDQLVVIMQRLSQQGVQGMKMGSELSKVLKENNGDISAIEQSLGLQAGALSNASQLTGQYAGKIQDLADEEAEHKSILDQLNAAWEDMSLALSPILSPLGSVMGLIGQAGSWAVGVNGLIQLAQTTKIATAMQWLWNAALAANPITLIILAIAALIAILAYLYFNNEQVRNSINALGQAFIQAGQIIYTTIVNAVNWVITQLQMLYEYIMTLGGILPEQANITGNQIIDSILMFLAFLATLPAQIAMYFANVIASTLGFGDNFVQNMINSASQAVNGFVSWIVQLPQRLGEELNQMIQQALDFAAQLPQIIAEAGRNMVFGWIGGSGEHSPGFMYEALVGELLAMVNAPPQMLGDLINWISEYGYQMGEVLSQALLGISFDDLINNILWLITSLNSLQEWIYTAGGLIPESVEITGNRIIDTIIRIIAFVATMPAQLGGIFANTIASTLGFGSNFSQNMINAASRAVNGFVSWIGQMSGRLAGELDNMIQQALDFASRLPQIIGEAAANMVGSWVGGSGEQSPGFMFDAYEGELKEMDKIGIAFSKSLPATMKFTGSEMVRNFNPNFNSEGGGSAFGGNTYNITLEIGSVDKRERVNEIIETIRDYIEWDNTTAGRTV